MTLSYKGYRIGSIEKDILKLLLGVKDIELPKKGSEPSFYNIFKTANQKRNFPATIQRLKSKGLVYFRYEDGKIRASISDKGKSVSEIILEKGIELRQSNIKWNGVWHIVIFDIPQERQVSRDILRGHLKRFGFRQVQASVWAYPFPCEDIITLVKNYFELGDEVLYLKVTSLEGDSKLRKLFKL
ncbi:MAG: hypothetical protein KBC17_02060 [Candidatus Pacebacteria bacterium]|nr:hypothetical protein [Candidatus Paceibacterota bacterium]